MLAAFEMIEIDCLFVPSAVIKGIYSWAQLFLIFNYVPACVSAHKSVHVGVGAWEG